MRSCASSVRTSSGDHLATTFERRRHAAPLHVDRTRHFYSALWSRADDAQRVPSVDFDKFADVTPLSEPAPNVSAPGSGFAPCSRWSSASRGTIERGDDEPSEMRKTNSGAPARLAVPFVHRGHERRHLERATWRKAPFEPAIIPDGYAPRSPLALSLRTRL